LGAIVCLAWIVGAVPALPVDAHAQVRKGQKAEKQTGEKQDNGFPEVPGDDIFGFTAATDTGEKGDFGFANELNGFRGKRDGHYQVFSNKLEWSYTPFENWWFAASGFIARHNIHDVLGAHNADGASTIPDIHATQFEGLSAEVQYRFLKRSAGNPLALAVAAEPFRSRIDLATGQPAKAYGAAFKLLADAVIIPDRLFWAANVIWVPVRSQDPADLNTWLSTSGSSLQTALTLQLTKDVFVGAEVRQLAAYDGSFFDQRVGYAYYLGPTFLWKISEQVAFNATWQPQIAGRSIDNPTLRYDLDHFDRAQFRFKLVIGLN
jgi:hypothetical protein